MAHDSEQLRDKLNRVQRLVVLASISEQPDAAASAQEALGPEVDSMLPVLEAWLNQRGASMPSFMSLEEMILFADDALMAERLDLPIAQPNPKRDRSAADRLTQEMRAARKFLSDADVDAELAAASVSDESALQLGSSLPELHDSPIDYADEPVGVEEGGKKGRGGSSSRGWIVPVIGVVVLAGAAYILLRRE